jgi:hypothetical protein
MVMRKSMSFLLVALVATFMFTGCLENATPKAPTADQVLQRQTEQAMAEANRQSGMPDIKNFKQKKTLKLIQELCDSEDLICYAYLWSEIKAEAVFIGKCAGYGIPFSAQYTSPEKFGTVDGGEYGARNPYTLPQPDPNGLFMPTSSDATWLLMFDEAGEIHPVYFEPKIIVSPFPLNL